MNILEAKVFHNMPMEVLKGNNVKHYKKYLRDAKNLYKDNNIAVDHLETIVYEVYSYTKGEEEKQGNLFWGLTVMYPVYINGECNMTRGHYHQDKNCAEFYFGLEGDGVLLLMDKDGQTWAEKITKGSLHHIEGHVAHRIVNTGEHELKVGACWPTTAGHDYETIENKEFPYRVFKDNGEIRFVKRD